MRVRGAFASSRRRRDRDLFGESRGITHHVRSERSARDRAPERRFRRARRLATTGRGASSQQDPEGERVAGRERARASAIVHGRHPVVGPRVIEEESAEVPWESVRTEVLHRRVPVLASLTGASSSARNCLILLSARRERHAQRVRVTPAGVLSIVDGGKHAAFKVFVARKICRKSKICKFTLFADYTHTEKFCTVIATRDATRRSCGAYSAMF